MGDISAEPSMEDILSSIKRIIAEENDAPARARRAVRPAPPQATPFDDDEILELHEHAPEPAPMPEPARLPEPSVAAAPSPEPEQAHAPEPVAMTPAPAPEPRVAPAPAERILSAQAAEASRSPLEALSRLVVKPDTAGSDTLEGLVREMLRPMLREWLEANLPSMVEQMVAREIQRITGN